MQNTTSDTPAGEPVTKLGSGREKSRTLKPLASLMPLVMRHRARVAAAIVALVVAAGATLAVPLAVRRVIDHGFSAANAQFVDQYFAMMLLVVAILAMASAGRYYFVTWIGERVAADVRDKVFSHLLTLSSVFWDANDTGEVMSRLTADTTQIKTVFGSSVSVALRNAVMLVGAMGMMVWTSPKLSGLVLIAIPLIVLPLVLFGRKVRRLSRFAQDTLASSAAMAQETLQAMPAVQANAQERRLDESFSQSSLTHDPKLDDPALDVALRSEAFYIAALGSKRTHAARLERLGALGHEPPDLGRIHGPAGLQIGAVSPAEVALSVMAEMTRVLRLEPAP